jgi:hypothetical protein
MGGFHAALLVGSVTFGPVIDAEGADRGRIQRHLEAVEQRLRAADTSHLSPEQQRERARNLDRLRAYWQAGVFPRNHAFLGERVPYFIDASETLCAVGYLVVESGFREVADEIFEHENNAKLLEMTHPALPGWIEASGLTAQEHAAIQPAYCGCNEVDETLVCGSDGKTYANACVAETCAGVEIEHEGPCWSDGTTGWPAPGTSSSDEDDAGPATETSASDGPENETAGTSGGHESASTGQADKEPNENVPQEDDGALRRGCRLGDVPRLSLVLLPVVLLTMRRRRSRCDEAR